MRMIRNKLHSRSAFTIIELVLVLVIIVVVSTISGMNYYQAVKNARVETAAEQIVGLIQEARSLAISNKMKGTNTIAYKVSINRQNANDNIRIEQIPIYPLGDGPIMKSISTLPRISYTDVTFQPAVFDDSENQINLKYYLPNANLTVEDQSGNNVVKLSFNINDRLTGRKVRVTLNTISGLVETELVPN